MRFLKQKFLQIDGPTWVVAAVLYGAWLLMIWYNALLPWWIIMPVGAYLVAWHFSLQHEAIHSFRGVPAWLRFAVVYAPLGLWFPYPLYRKSHTTHHRDINLTIPGVDTESYYVLQADWARMGAFKRRLLIVNQTMAGRLLIGPLLRLWSLISKEYAPRGPRRYQSLAALDRARGRARVAVLVRLGRMRSSLVAVLPAHRLSGIEPRAAARLHRASRRRRFPGENRLGGIERPVRRAVPV